MFSRESFSPPNREKQIAGIAAIARERRNWKTGITNQPGLPGELFDAVAIGLIKDDRPREASRRFGVRHGNDERIP
jgi:hypothetical protein